MFNERFTPTLERELITITGGGDINETIFTSYLGGFDSAVVSLTQRHDDDSTSKIMIVGGTSRKITSSTVEPELFSVMKSKRSKRSRASESVMRFKPQMCKRIVYRDRPIKKLSQMSDDVPLSCPRNREFTNTTLSSDARSQLIDDFDTASHIDEIVGAHEDSSDVESVDSSDSEDTPPAEVELDDARKWNNESRLVVQDINSAIDHISHHPKLTGDIARALETVSEILVDVSQEVFANGSDFALGDALL